MLCIQRYSGNWGALFNLGGASVGGRGITPPQAVGIRGLLIELYTVESPVEVGVIDVARKPMNRRSPWAGPGWRAQQVFCQ